MATSSLISSSFLPTTLHRHQLSLFNNHAWIATTSNNNNNRFSFRVQAAKLPAGVEVPKVEPKFQAPFLGFTTTAEIWNSRACMIGLIGTFILELIINKGILEVIGLEVGKGLDIPL
ncbi:hypothetical protein LWI29_027098 [Acer saccharum]|uniref:Uncharacterized protein n=1 Tax=Acer saccharum TaxID=4024 RepID=A0AA39S9Q8_ACESA|nr:hypothetical protein LWI29_027098 [Acer saccharum]KAK1563890.1 hypothetical protein Q3G72_034747 [Acer saccharum]